MNYEMKYNEALERAKRWADGTLQPDRTTPQGVCETIFPELAESENEKIRKWIVGYAKGQIDGFSLVDDEECNKIADQWRKAIAYLEKQKEASDAIEAVERIDKYITENISNSWEMDDSNPDKKYYCGVDDTLSNIAGILQGVYAKQKEQKDYHKLYEDIAKSKWFKKAYEGKSLGCDYEQKEQKPMAWSEEDATMLARVIEEYDFWIRAALGKIAKDQYEEERTWLQLLPTRFRPQPHWKPSEEQMNSLNFGIHALEEEGYDDTAREIKELYEQLKKLMED